MYSQRYERGVPVTEVEDIGAGSTTGTKTTFKPDDEIFETVEYNQEIVAHRLRELAFLNRGLTIALKDLRDDFEETFRYDGGLQAFVEYMDEGRSALHEPVHFGGERDGVVTEVALQYKRFLPAKYFELCQQHPHTRGGHTRNRIQNSTYANIKHLWQQKQCVQK